MDKMLINSRTVNSALLLLTFVSVLTSLAAAADEKVKLGVYIESLCPDSRRFFLKQLVPTYRSIGQIIEPHIVVFGKARTLGDNKMICQHGPNECEGNRQMACVQTMAKNSSEEIETIGCLFERQQTVDECVRRHIGASRRPLECQADCPAGAGGESGDFAKECTPEKSYKLMLEAEKETGRLYYVPRLTADGQSDEQTQHELETNLLQTVCKRYKGPNKPAACAANS